MSRGSQETLRSPEYQVLIELLKVEWKGSGKTQKEICDALGKPKNYLIKIEKGERRIDVIEVFRLCAVLEVDTLSLLKTFSQMVEKR